MSKNSGEAHILAQTNSAKCVMPCKHHTCPRLHSVKKLTVGLNKNPKYLVIDLKNPSFLFLFHIRLVVCTLFPGQLDLSHVLTFFHGDSVLDVLKNLKTLFPKQSGLVTLIQFKLPKEKFPVTFIQRYIRQLLMWIKHQKCLF